MPHPNHPAYIRALNLFQEALDRGAQPDDMKACVYELMGAAVFAHLKGDFYAEEQLRLVMDAAIILETAGRG